VLRVETAPTGQAALSGRIEKQDIPQLNLVLAPETNGDGKIGFKRGHLLIANACRRVMEDDGFGRQERLWRKQI